MECDACREALSARIDGEAEPVPAEQTDEHLRSCAECHGWHARAVELSRTLRVREAAPVPDLTAAILEDAPVLGRDRGWWPRLALGGVAVAQIGLALSQILGIGAHHDESTLAGHLFNESTAWNLAIGIGLFWSAFRPRATSGLIPVLAGFVVVLIGYSTHDLLNDAAPLSRVAGHGLLVAALFLLIVVNRVSTTPEPHGADQSDVEAGTAVETEQPAAPSPDQPESRPPLRPAGRHRAA